MGKWGGYAKQAKKGSGGKYVRLEPGDSIDFAVHPELEPALDRTHWKDGAKVSEGTAGAEANDKIMVCVYDVKARGNRLLRLGTGTFAKLGEKIDKFGEDMVFSLTRIGAGMKTKYEIDRTEKLTAEQQRHMLACESYDPLDESGIVPLTVPTEAAPEPAPAPKRAAPKAAAKQAAEPEPDADIPF